MLYKHYSITITSPYFSDFTGSLTYFILLSGCKKIHTFRLIRDCLPFYAAKGLMHSTIQLSGVGHNQHLHSSRMMVYDQAEIWTGS